MVAREEPPSRAICQRVSSDKHWGEAGYLHQLHGGPTRAVEITHEAPAPSRSPAEWLRLAGDYCQAVQPGLLAELAHNLGVSVASLKSVWIGWTGKAWSFPMSSPTDDIIGLRLRSRDGAAKWSERGGNNGLFLPSGHVAARGDLLIVEGPTESAAALDLGFAVIGRPSCSAYVAGTIQYLRLLAIRRGTPVDVVILSNRDVAKVNPITGKRFWPGQRGAGVLLRDLLRSRACRSVRVVLPPRGVKDLRDWKRAGLTREGLLAAIERARRIECGRSQRLAIAGG